MFQIALPNIVVPLALWESMHTSSFALSVGCKIVWLKNSNFASALDEAKLIKNVELIKAMTEDEVIPSQYRQLVRDNLGLNHMKSPEEIRRLFHWNLNGIIRFEALMAVFTTLACAPFRYIKNRRVLAKNSTYI